MKLANARTKKTSNRKKTSTKRKTQASKTQSNLVRVCLLLSLIAISIIAFFQLGIVGTFFYHLANLLLGSLASIFYLLLILGSLLVFIRFDLHLLQHILFQLYNLKIEILLLYTVELFSQLFQFSHRRVHITF